MAATGGPLLALSLDGRGFNVAHDSEANRMLGGTSNEVEPNGDGLTARLIKTVTPWSIDGLTVEVDDDRGDHQFLQALCNANRFFTVACTFASGATFQGSGQIVGELQWSSTKTTAGLSLKGPGTLTQQ